jgi:hypothetical protein
MTKRINKTWTFLWVILVLVLSTENAFAYLDLGTGTYLFQMIVSGFLTMIFAIKVYWNNLISFFKRLLKK